MFNKRSTVDVKKSIGKLQDCKKDSAGRLRHLKIILEHVDIEEAKSIFETNYSHVYYVLYDTFITAEGNLRQKELSFHIVHKAHRDELDGSLWLLGKVLCLLPELIAKRWQCHSLGRLLAKLLHHGNNARLRREGVRYFLLWYAALADNAPAHVHAMFNDLVPGLSLPQKGTIGAVEHDFNAIADLMNHPNMRGELGASVFHDASVHPVRAPEIAPLILPGSSERSTQPDPKDGLEVLLDCMVQATGCLKWRDDSPQKHMRCFAFLLQRFRDQYLPVFCPNFDTAHSLYEPRLELPDMRQHSKRDEALSGCVVKLINWVVRHTRERAVSVHMGAYVGGGGGGGGGDGDDSSEYASLLVNLRYMGYSQAQLVQDVLFSTRDTVNFVAEVYRQAFLLGFATRDQIAATRCVTLVVKEWINVEKRVHPPFFMDPVPGAVDHLHSTANNADLSPPRPPQQRLRTDSYLGAISRENPLVPAGIQYVLQTLVTNAANVFMVKTEYLSLARPTSTPANAKQSREASPLDEQTEICKCVLNIYRTMVMTARMDARSWEQLLLVLLRITAVILSDCAAPSTKRNLGGRLAQPVFQTLIVTWIRAHTHVPVPVALWEKFLNVLSSLTHHEELINEWNKTMQTLTRVMARHVYQINLQDLPLDRLAEAKNKRRRVGIVAGNGGGGGSVGSGAVVVSHGVEALQWQANNEPTSAGSSTRAAPSRNSSGDPSAHPSFRNASRSQRRLAKKSNEPADYEQRGFLEFRSSGLASGSSTLNRSYSEGSLAPFRKSRTRKRLKSNSSSGSKMTALPHDVEHSLAKLKLADVSLSISSDTLNMSKVSSAGNGEASNGSDAVGGSVGGGKMRRALSLDSLKQAGGEQPESDSFRGSSRSPSPTASSGLDAGSIKDSPLQIDGLSTDNNSLEAHGDMDGFGGGGGGGNSFSAHSRRSILMGGTTRGWLPDVAAVMWKRMLGSMGDVNHIPNPKLHATVFRHLISTTLNLIKIRMNQGVAYDAQTAAAPVTFVPPIGSVAPWCYGALALDAKFAEGKLCALRLLCTIARHGQAIGKDEIPMFYYALHRALTGHDRQMSYIVLRYLGGPRFLSLLLPGHSLLLLDMVNACTVILTSGHDGHSAAYDPDPADIEHDANTNVMAPRAQAAALICALLCFPRPSLPTTFLKPHESDIDVLEFTDQQEHILNVVLRFARREPSSKARCIAIASLGQWVLQHLVQRETTGQMGGNAARRIPTQRGKRGGDTAPQVAQTCTPDAGLRAALHVILQSLQFKHATIARVAAEAVKLFAERGRQLAEFEGMPRMIVNEICTALEVQNVPNPKDSDKVVLTSLLLCLGEFCMAVPVRLLTEPMHLPGDAAGGLAAAPTTLIANVLRILHQIATGMTAQRIKHKVDEDFVRISMDNVRVERTGEADYQTTETTMACRAAIRLCAKTVAMHLVTNVGHFPMGIGATRLSSTVDEHDDMIMAGGGDVQHNSAGAQQPTASTARELLDAATQQVLNSAHLQMFLLNPGLAASFVELPALKLPGGGITAGLQTAEKQVRVLLRDLNGKACWDVSVLYREPQSAARRRQRAEAARDRDGRAANNVAQRGGALKLDQAMSGSSVSGGKTIGVGGGVAMGGAGSPGHMQRTFQLGAAASLDPMTSSVGMPMHHPLRHTMRHRPPHQLPVARDQASDLDQLDDLLQYIGHTSPECLEASGSPLNAAGASPLGGHTEAMVISTILNQRAMETDYVARLKPHHRPSIACGDSINPWSIGAESPNHPQQRGVTSLPPQQQQQPPKQKLPFHYCRLLFSHLGMAGWERRRRTHLLKRTDKLLRELRNLDTQRCRETHKVAVIYVASGQEEKGSILRNSCGSSTYEMFVSALGWEIELESHNGFLGGFARQGCGSTSPYYATPFLEVMYHVATRMPSDTTDDIHNKTRHLGNDEVHIVWSEHHRDYRRDILPTEFCDVLIVVYPLRSGLFRVTVNRKAEVPWFGPLFDETVVGGASLAALVRATAINASRAKRTSLPFYQQFYEERKRSLETVSSRHKDSNTYEDFAARIYTPIPSSVASNGGASSTTAGSSNNSHPPLAAALLDHHPQHHRSSGKSWIQHLDGQLHQQQQQQQQLYHRDSTGSHSTHNHYHHHQHQLSSGSASSVPSATSEQPSPRAPRKMHPFKSSTSKTTSKATSSSVAGGSTPPDSPTLPGRRFK